MKRYRHYNKDRAIVLSCFGSVIEEKLYLELKKEVKKRFEGIDIFISFSSRMVLKLLQKKGKEFKNLPQTLADVDMLGYKNIVVVSINLFPTDEHEFTKKIVDGFKNFSLANIRITDAILTKTKETTLFLKNLNDAIKKDEVSNFYIIHGTPRLDIKGIDSITYSSEYLELLGKNYTCSLEGAYPYYAMKDIITQKMKKDGVKKVQIVPMLLVSGNHYDKDMQKIKEDLREEFESSIVESLTKHKKFNLIELEEIREIIFKNIDVELTKLG